MQQGINTTSLRDAIETFASGSTVMFLYDDYFPEHCEDSCSFRSSFFLSRAGSYSFSCAFRLLPDSFNYSANYPEQADAQGSYPSFSFPIFDLANPICLVSPQSAFFVSSQTFSPITATKFLSTMAGPASNAFGVSVKQVGRISKDLASVATTDLEKYASNAACTFQGFGTFVKKL
jgi:hypothetical protein